MRLLLAALLSLILCAAASAADRAIVILDGSGSMWAQIDSKARIEIARDTLREVLGTLPSDLELGFMSYGHRTKGDCNDIELLVPPAAGTAQQIIAAADAISPKGKTPISAAVKQAAEALQYTEDKATVILITDGIETCEADPCQLGADLESQGVDFTVHVIGFGLSDQEGQEVACLAENTGGKYLSASDAGSLADALTTTVAQVDEPSPVTEPAAPPPEPVAEFNFEPTAVMAEGDDPLPSDFSLVWEIYHAQSDGSQGEYATTEYGGRPRLNLEPGAYVIASSIGEATTSQPVTITAGEAAAPLFVLNAGTVVVRPRPAEGEPPDDSAAVTFALPDGSTTTNYGPQTYYLPAGEQTMTVELGAASASETFQLAAGEVIEKDFVIGVGHVTVNAFYVEGMRVEDSSLFVEIVEAKKAIDGTRKSLSYAYGPDSGHDIPPGDYVLVATMDQAVTEVPFTITSGEGKTIDAILNAGVIAIDAPGYDFIEILGKPDIAGNRKSFGYNYGGTKQGTLPPGDYTIVAHLPGDTGQKEVPAMVKAGERTEVTVPLE
jgi:Ca-activated chloride channel family protein